MPEPKKPVTNRKFESGSPHILATWGIVGFIAAACAILIGLESFRIVNQRSETLANSRMDTANITKSLIQHAELTFRTADAILIGVVERLAHETIDVQMRQQLKSWFLQEVRHSSQFVSFAVIDSEGALIVDSFAAKEPINFVDRECFIFQRTHDEDALHIGKPVRDGLADGWIIPVTRRFNKPDGTFGGVVVAAINIFRTSTIGLISEQTAPSFSHH
jgi:hypothetical protein